MSTGTRRSRSTALADAIAFREMLSGTYERWEIAGSVRRERPEVGDVEHVVIQRVGLEEEGMLAGMGEAANFFHQRLDLLVGDTTSGVTKAVYSNGTHRWGEKYRGIMYRGFRHELFCADADNWGAILAIRTGPAEFSQGMVTRLLNRGRYRQKDGYVRIAAGEHAGAIVPVATEEEFFRLCVCGYLAPERRDDVRVEA